MCTCPTKSGLRGANTGEEHLQMSCAEMYRNVHCWEKDLGLNLKHTTHKHTLTHSYRIYVTCHTVGMLLSTVKQLATFHGPIPSAIQLCANSGFPAMYMTQTHQINFVCAVYLLVFNPWLTE